MTDLPRAWKKLPRLAGSKSKFEFRWQHPGRGEFMSKRLRRSVLIGAITAGAVLASEVRGSFGADSNAFLPPQMGSTAFFTPEIYAAALQPYLQTLTRMKKIADWNLPLPHASEDLQADSQSESNSKFDGRFWDIAKESKKVRFGSLSIITSFTNSNKLSWDGPSKETQQDQTIALDLTEFRKSTAAPSSVYVNSFVKETPYQTLTETSPPRTTGIGAGAYWGWNSGNASVSYSNYYSSVDGLSYSSGGQSVEASISAYAGAIGVYAGLKYNASEEFSALSNAVGRSYDAYSSVSYKPRYLPDIVFEGGFGRHDYSSFVFTSDVTYRSATLGFDFSKYLWSPVETKSKLPMAKLFYRYYDQIDHSIVGAAPWRSQLVGMMFRAGL